MDKEDRVLNNWIIVTIGVITLFAIFLALNAPVNASSFPNQLNYSVSSVSTAISDGVLYSTSTTQRLGNGYSGQIDYIKIKYSSINGCRDLSVNEVYDGAGTIKIYTDSGYSNQTSTPYNWAKIVWASSTEELILSPDITIYPYTPPLILYPTYYYTFSWSCIGNYHLSFRGSPSAPLGQLYTGSSTVSGNLFLSFNDTSSTGGIDDDIASSQLIWPPANTSSTPFPDWTGDWKIRITSSTIGKNYLARVEYILLDTNSPVYTNSYNFNDYLGVTPSTSTFDFQFPKTHPLTPFAAGTYYYKWGIHYFFGLDSTFVNNLSESYWFTFIERYASAPTSTDASGVGQFTSTSTDAEISAEINARWGATGCDISSSSTYSIWEPADWKCMFVSTLNQIASSTLDKSTKLFGILYDRLSVVFPLSIIKSFNDDIQQAKATTTQNMVVGLPAVGIFPAMVLASSGTPAWVSSHLGFNYINFLDKVMYAFAGIVMLFVAIGVIRKLNHHNTGSPPQA